MYILKMHVYAIKGAKEVALGEGGEDVTPGKHRRDRDVLIGQWNA